MRIMLMQLLACVLTRLEIEVSVHRRNIRKPSDIFSSTVD